MNDSNNEFVQENRGFQDKLIGLFNGGLNNIRGVIVSIIAIVSLYLPVMDSNFGGSASIMDQSIGPAILGVLVVNMIAFYGGASRFIVRIAAFIYLGMILFFYYSYFAMLIDYFGVKHLFRYSSRTGPMGVFDYIAWGMLVNVLSGVSLFSAAFLRRYTKNPNAI